MPVPRPTDQRAWITGLLLAIGVAMVAPGTHAAPLFAAPFLSFDPRSGPHSMAVADLNADGLLDVVTADVFSDTVSVLLGIGGGILGSRMHYGVGAAPSSVAIGDLDHDGKPDLIVTNLNANTISVLLGNGMAGFGSKTVYGAGDHPRSVVIGDLNADGNVDAVVANQDSMTVSVLIGHGDGSFGPRTAYVVNDYSWNVALGDLNGDGVLDLAVVGMYGGISVLIGEGDGHFGVRNDYPAFDYAGSVAIGDLNRDGKPDLVLANSSSISVRLGRGDGTFGERIDRISGIETFSAVIADVNRDGTPDVVVGYDYPGPISVFPGKGDGTFGVETHFAAGPYPARVMTADLNGDGKLDIVAASATVNSIALSLGNGDGSFGFGTVYDTGASPRFIAIGDLNGDGRPDLVTANADANTVSVRLDDGHGSFGARTDYATGSVPQSVTIGDLNGDGRSDLVVANGYGHTVSVLLGAGGGTFMARTDFDVGGLPITPAIGDMNGDGEPDITMPIVYGSRQGSASTLLGLGNGSFGSAIVFPVVIDATPTAGAVADVNGDGRLDLIVAADIDWVMVLGGMGDGSFSWRAFVPAPGRPSLVAVGDLNGDGKQDLVTGGNPLSLIPGLGAGAFGAPKSLGTGGWAVAIGDLNGDGHPDVATVNPTTYAVSVLLGDGVGDFAPSGDYDYGTNGFPISLAIGDLNGDGLLDLATVSSFSNSISLLFNSGGRDLTPTLLSMFDAKWSDHGVEVRWQFGPGAAVHETVLERSGVSAGLWTRVTGNPVIRDGIELIVDQEAPRDRECSYRLRVTLATGETVTFGPIQASGSSPAEFALLPVRPNPSHGLTSIAYATPRESWVRLSVLDTQGRRAALLVEGRVAAGRHTLGPDAASAAAVRPGLYFLRLDWPGGSMTRRLVVVR